jgi:hypothetical protein
MKQQAVFIGNCQCSGILELLKFTSFFDKYDVKQYANWQIIKDKSAPPIQDIETADLIVYQPLSDVHGCYSTNLDNDNSMFRGIKDYTTLISFPRIHNNSLWPIYNKGRIANHIYYGDNFLEYYYNQNIRTKSQFLYLYDSGQFDFKFQERYDKNIKISREKENITDIKIIDYIVENIRNYPLFLTQDHPTSRIFYQCVKQMSQKLDIEFKEDFNIDTIDINITKLEDSTYQSPTMMYPLSTYSVNYFNYKWSLDDNDTFYRYILINYLENKNIR